MSEIYYDERYTVLHWYDFVCPFSYIGQARTPLLAEAGFNVVELPFQAHPAMPRGGLPVRPGYGSRHTAIEREAEAVGFELRWPRRIPHSRRALAAAEWVRRHQFDAFDDVRRALFDAHFVRGQDIDDPAVIDRHVAMAGVDVGRLRAALADGSAVAAVARAEWVGSQAGVDGTPAWMVDGRPIIGLQPAEVFRRLAPATARACW